jgi:uncharacterized SAM-binding protein YcdF (DUF218 family)
MFLASKILAFAVEPLFWVLLLLAGGLLAGLWRPVLGRAGGWGALMALVLSLWTPIPVALLQRLESRFPPLPTDTDLRPYAGVVVLGGAIAHWQIWAAHRQVALNEQAERMTTAVALARRYPHLQLLFTGGVASVAADGLTEAARARQFFDEMGVDRARVLYEDKSRNTFENAVFSARVQGVRTSDRWLLLTSANHMPRAMGVFTKAGWNVTPYPVDYRTADKIDWLDFDFNQGPNSWQLVAHELLGYYAYRWLGKL